MRSNQVLVDRSRSYRMHHRSDIHCVSLKIKQSDFV